MFNKQKKSVIFSIIAIIFFALLILFGSSVLGVSSETEEDGLFFEATGLGFLRKPATKASLVVLSANLHEKGGEAALESITASSGGKKVEEIKPQEELENISSQVSRESELKELLLPQTEIELYEPGRLQKIEKVEDKIDVQELEIDLTKIKPDLKPGDKISIQLKGDFEVAGGSSHEEMATYEIAYLNPLPKIKNWLPGDAHIHTDYSDGGSWRGVRLTVWEADTIGFEWLILTDHFS